jgi:hypothetical protein
MPYLQRRNRWFLVVRLEEAADMKRPMAAVGGVVPPHLEEEEGMRKIQELGHPAGRPGQRHSIADTFGDI